MWKLSPRVIRQKILHIPPLLDLLLEREREGYPLKHRWCSIHHRRLIWCEPRGLHYRNIGERNESSFHFQHFVCVVSSCPTQETLILYKQNNLARLDWYLGDGRPVKFWQRHSCNLTSPKWAFRWTPHNTQASTACQTVDQQKWMNSQSHINGIVLRRKPVKFQR